MNFSLKVDKQDNMTILSPKMMMCLFIYTAFIFTANPGLIEAQTITASPFGTLDSITDRTAKKEAPTPSIEYVPDQYIVVLNDNENNQKSRLKSKSYSERQDDMRNIAHEIMARYNLSDEKVGHVYGSSIHGFVVSDISETEMNQLMNDEQVAYIERDELIHLPTQSISRDKKASSSNSSSPSSCSFLKINGMDFDNGSATFGASQYAIHSEIIVANDGINPTADACTPIQNTVSNKVVLIDRGDCEYGVKALHAENAGAIAVIIANNVPAAIGLMGPGAQGSQVTIPVISVSMADGDTIKQMIAQGMDSVILDNQITTQCTPWGITRVNGGLSGAGKRAWIIDTGVDTLHPDLIVNTALSATFAPGTSNFLDESGHGTHVSGTVAALDNGFGVVGVAAGAEIVAVRVFDGSGSGLVSDIIAGVNYVAANASANDVANMSLRSGANQAMDDAVLAASNTCKFVLAAGNDALNANIFSPGRVNGPNIYTISAMDRNDQFASFSNYGNPPVEYCQPGVGVLSTYLNGAYAMLSGTSMAAPHFTGLLLLGDVCASTYVLNDPDDQQDAIATHDDGTMTDDDGDGFDICVDCDDSDSTRYPGAIEICDGIDNDCNGIIDDGNVCCTGDSILYVKADANGINSGSDWANAFTDLQDALKSTCPGITQIWVAGGTYKPSRSDPFVSFVMKNGVSMYGGFPGISGQENDTTMRDPDLYPSILDGDLFDDDLPNFGNWDENSSVLLIADSIDNTSVISGFSVINGGFGLYSGGMDVFHSDLRIDQMKFSNNQTVGGGGMFIEGGHPHVINCQFDRNIGELEGGAIRIWKASATISKCTFTGNKSQTGGAIFYYNFGTASPKQLLIQNCTFPNNISKHDDYPAGSGGAIHLAGYQMTDIDIVNCVFNNNSSASTSSFSGGGHISAYATQFDVTNCTFANGYSSNSGGAFHITNNTSIPDFISKVNVVNSIFIENEANNTDDIIFVDTPDSSTLINCLLDTVCPTKVVCQSVVVDTNRVFESIETGDLQLWSCSPAIDAGTTVNAPPLDIDGNSRIDVIIGGGIVDIGAYEYQGSYGDVDNDGDGYTICAGDCDDDEINVHPGATEICDGIDNDCDGLIDEDKICCPVFVQKLAYVNAAASGLNDGSSWTDAYVDLQDAFMDECVTEIWVTEGIYTPSSNGKRDASFDMRNHLSVYGGFPTHGNPGFSDRDWQAHPTILSGDLLQDDTQSPLATDARINKNTMDNSHNIINVSGVDSTAIVDGFNITAGVADGLTGMTNGPLRSGGGIYNDYGTPVIRNCNIIGNFAISGGGIFSRDSTASNALHLSNCHIIGNLAGGGGGIYLLGGKYNITDSEISNNQADYGGGLHGFFSITAEIENCTFSQNNADTDGGGIRSGFSNDFKITNCTFNQNNGGTSGAISSIENSRFDLLNCDFNFNSSENGGAIRQAFNGVSTIRGCTFNTNNAGNAGAGVHTTGTYLIIEGSEFLNNSGTNGVGVYSNNTFLDMSDCHFEGNVATNWGGGLFAENGGTFYLTNCNLYRNGALYGGGLFNRSAGYITNCEFIENTIIGLGGGAAVCNYQTPIAIHTNCIIKNNDNPTTNGAGAVLNQFASPQFINCTFSGNTADYAATMISYEPGDRPALKNCIIYNDVSDSSAMIVHVNGSMTDISYSIINLDTCPANTICDSSVLFNVDPLFVSDDNLHLQACSPAIDAGLDSVNMILIDLDSNTRKKDIIPGNAHIDMGAYERQADITANRLYVNAGATKSKEGTSWDNPFNDLQEALLYDCPQIDEIWVAKGTYKPTSGDDRWASFDLKNNLRVYGGFLGNEADSFDLELRDFELNESILSGEINLSDSTDNSYTIVYGVNLDSTALLDGFTIEQANGNSDFGFPSDPARGGGMHLNGGNPILNNLTFKNNSAVFGGGIYLFNAHPVIENCTFLNNHQTANGWGGGGLMAEGISNPIIRSCTFEENRGFFGGGVYFSNGNATVENCIFSWNIGFIGGGAANVNSTTSHYYNSIFRDNTAYSGGGVANYSSASLINCTVYGNEIDNVGGGVYNEGSSPIISNCIIWDNVGIDMEGPATPVVSHSIVQGGYTGTNNIDADPLFVSDTDLRPLPCSPAIDAGDNSMNILPMDLHGNPRIFNATAQISPIIDMGAFEMDTDNSLPAIWTGLGNGSSWTDPMNWNDEYIPQTCRDVVIPFGNVIIPTGTQALGRTLDVLLGAEILTETSGEIDIKH